MRRLAGLLLIACTLTACTPTADTPLPTVRPANIDVDTPALRAMKKGAGIATCEPGTGHNDLPEVTLPCFGGGPDVRLNTLEGPLVVNLWASYCRACRHEMPIYQEFAEKYVGSVGVIGIDYEDTQTEAAMQLAVDTGVTFPLLADPQSALNGADPLPVMTYLPLLVLVGADGRVAYQAPVQITTLGELEELVATHLGVTA